MRKMHKGNEIYITGTPALCKGKITHVTVNIRDLTELQRLQEQVSRLTALYISSAADNQTAKLLGEHIVAESRVMRHLIDLAVRVANVDSVIFIQGESGTGKEVLARLIHSLSPEARGLSFRSIAALFRKIFSNQNSSVMKRVHLQAHGGKGSQVYSSWRTEE